MQPTMTLEEIEEFILDRLPGILERDPRFVTFIEGIVAEKFPRRDEFARLLDEVQQHRTETAQQSQRVEQRVERVEQQLQEHRTETAEQFKRVDQRFEQVDQRFDRIDQRFDQADQRFAELVQRVEDGFRNVQISIDRLGARWGIRNEALFRQTMREVLEKSYGAKVEARVIEGEQFDCIIIDNAHILIEISASVGKDILKRLQRKRQLYTDATGVAPSRFLLVVGSIYSQRANALRDAGFEVIEPEIDEAV